jgi:hypothetical protein
MLTRCLLLATLFLSGCSFFQEVGDPESSVVGGGIVQIASTNQILDTKNDQYDDARLFYLIDPLEKSMSRATFVASQKTEYAEADLDKAFYYANTAYDAAHRNAVMDRLLISAENRCNVYFTYLKRMSTNTNAVFGTLTTLLGGAGAIVSGETAARILSGAAGISSGTRAELNQAMFQSMSTSVIIPGIKASRRSMLTRIEAKKSKSLSEYSVQAAIADVVRYNGECSMDTGLDYAQKTMILYSDVGMSSFIEAQQKIELGRNQLDVLGIDNLDKPILATQVLGLSKKRLQDSLAELKDDVPAQKALKDKGKDLLSKMDGSLKTDADKLDAPLKDLYLQFGQSTGLKQKELLLDLNKQQKSVKEFKNNLDSQLAVFDLYLFELKQ